MLSILFGQQTFGQPIRTLGYNTVGDFQNSPTYTYASSVIILGHHAKDRL